MNNKYRLDIEGLRALAVLLVVVFHISPTDLPGGFIGVDVFFVISGFLITRIILNSLSVDKFTFSGFYLKRLRRLFPAYFAVVIASSIAMLFIGLPSEIKVFGESALSSLWYLSNVYFLTQSSYFDSAMQTNMLLHTWSLSVEEQFYLLYPAFLFICFKYFRQYLFAAFVSVLLVSFVANILVVNVNESVGFYLTPFRFWQFMLGGALVFLPSTIRVPRWVCELLIVIGFIFILASGYYFSEETLFPGFNSVYPTVGAVLIIFVGSNSVTMLGRVLSCGVSTFIGKISYSLYLWHWPVIVFYKLQISAYPRATDKVLLLIVCMVMGYVGWLLFEKPMRKIELIRENIKYFYCFCFSMLAISFGSVFLIASNGTSSRFSDEVLAYESFLNYDIQSYSRGGECYLNSEFNDVKEINYKKCISRVSGMKNVLLIGDSHSAHYYSALKEYYPSLNISQANSSGCRPIVNRDGGNRCEKLINKIFDDYVVKEWFDAIIIAGRWKNHEISAYKDTVKSMLRTTKEVYFVGPVIEYVMPVPRLLVSSDSSDLSMEDTKNLTNYRSARALEKKLFEGLAGEEVNGSRLKMISVLDVFCETGACAMTGDERIPYQFDYGHLTKSGAKLVLDKMQL